MGDLRFASASATWIGGRFLLPGNDVVGALVFPVPVGAPLVVFAPARGHATAGNGRPCPGAAVDTAVDQIRVGDEVHGPAIVIAVDSHEVFVAPGIDVTSVLNGGPVGAGILGGTGMDLLSVIVIAIMIAMIAIIVNVPTIVMTTTS